MSIPHPKHTHPFQKKTISLHPNVHHPQTKIRRRTALVDHHRHHHRHDTVSRLAQYQRISLFHRKHHPDRGFHHVLTIHLLPPYLLYRPNEMDQSLHYWGNRVRVFYRHHVTRRF